MTVIHIVLFQFLPTASPPTIRAACARLLGLKDECIRPGASEPYMQVSSGGVDCSVEGLQGGLTHGFVMHFASEEDRDYYVHKDPAHTAFVKSLDGIVKEARVVDYVPGVF